MVNDGECDPHPIWKRESHNFKRKTTPILLQYKTRGNHDKRCCQSSGLWKSSSGVTQPGFSKPCASQRSLSHDKIVSSAIAGVKQRGAWWVVQKRIRCKISKTWETWGRQNLKIIECGQILRSHHDLTWLNYLWAEQWTKVSPVLRENCWLSFPCPNRL